MDGVDLPALVKTGEQLFLLKLFLTSMHSLWVYDYFLTLGDEIKYVWAGKRSWMFMLFFANRYTPVLNLVWSIIILHNYTSSFCQRTDWWTFAYSTAINVLAQFAVATRIYAITGRNRLLIAPLLALILAQLGFGIYSVVWVAVRPIQQVPVIDLYVFKVCPFQQWRLGELLFVSIALAFDLFAFVIIFFTTKRRGAGRHPGIPTILDTIFRDSTIYFMVIFLCQFLGEIFTLVDAGIYKLLPGAASTVILPVMASRLILSLKKAGSEHTQQRSLPTIGLRSVSFVGDEDAHLAPPMYGESHRISGGSSTPNRRDMELDFVSQSPRNRGSLQLQ